jgi:pimeloyl-ACP methyl ester carboxylesterase
MISDAHELVLYLKNRFGQEKIYLMGFSWGTVIGMSLAEQFPQDFNAYIGVSQIINTAASEHQSLSFVQQKAIELSNSKATTALENIDPSYTSVDWYKQLSTQRAWLLRFNGVYKNANSYAHEIWMMLKAPEYSIFDFALWPGRSSQSLISLWPEVMNINFSQTMNRVQVPVYFFVGRFDQNCSSQLIASYYELLDAPAGKKLIWFENSAHDLFFDEPDLIEVELQSILKGRQ